MWTPQLFRDPSHQQITSLTPPLLNSATFVLKQGDYKNLLERYKFVHEFSRFPPRIFWVA